MKDSETNLEQIKEEVAAFIEERGWGVRQDLKSVAGAIMVEAGELYEIFQWDNLEESEARLIDPKQKEKIEDEVGDVLLSLANFANRAGIDLSESFAQKLAKTKAKFPTSVGVNIQQIQDIKASYRQQED